MSILALASMDKLLRKSGAQRVSESAKKAMVEVLEEYADKICQRSVQLAKHSGRTTIKAEDVKLATKT
jgi:histone H3/H4